METLAAPPSDPRADLAPHALHIWCIALDRCWPDPAAVSFETLSDDEQERSGRFRFDEDRRRYAGTRQALRSILSHYLNLPPPSIRFHYLEHGKPALDPGQNPTEIQFNLSHAHDLSVIGVTRSRAVGIDVEYKKRKVNVEELSGRFFSPTEQEELTELSPDELADGFFNAWTRKEAYIKGLGSGLSRPLDSFDVSLKPGDPARLLACREKPDEVTAWTLLDLRLLPDYAGAAAVAGEVTPWRCWAWQPGALP